MTTATILRGIKWEQKNYGTTTGFSAVIGGANVYVRRVITVKSWSYETSFGRVPGVAKPRHTSRCTLFFITVIKNDKKIEETRFDNLRMAKTRAVVIARTI